MSRFTLTQFAWRSGDPEVNHARSRAPHCIFAPVLKSTVGKSGVSKWDFRGAYAQARGVSRITVAGGYLSRTFLWALFLSYKETKRERDDVE